MQFDVATFSDVVLIHTWCLIASGLVACFFWKPNPSYTNRKDSECEKNNTSLQMKSLIVAFCSL